MCVQQLCSQSHVATRWLSGDVCICCNIITTGLKKCILTKNEDVVLPFTQGFAVGIPCSAKENVMSIGFVVCVGTSNRTMPTSIYCTLPITPPRKGQNGPVPCASGQKMQRSTLSLSSVLSKGIICRQEICQRKSCVSMGLNVLLSRLKLSA